jgi:predicted nucleic acid-binding protein
MHQGSVLPLEESLALSAARISVELKLPMADSIMLASARATGATFWTQDKDFEGMEGVRYVRQAKQRPGA